MASAEKGLEEIPWFDLSLLVLTLFFQSEERVTLVCAIQEHLKQS